MSKTWLMDNRGNRCSVEKWGSREAAQAALDSLKNCGGCTDCSRCFGCSRCTRCSWCTWCTRCTRCTRCSWCTRCSDCSGLYDAYAKHGSAKAPPQVPVIKNIHQRMFEAVSAKGALNMDTWHTCEKTHCRAGWAVVLAGADGKALEQFYNTELAAMMIYDASDANYRINPARFYDENDAALADMKALAEGAAS